MNHWVYVDIKVKSESKNKKKYWRNFHKVFLRKYLAKLDLNNMLRNKTATECWNILKYEIESFIEQFVPLKKKQGKHIRKYLAKLDWNNMLRNKTATECWNILKYEIESFIVPLKKKQGKRSRKSK